MTIVFGSPVRPTKNCRICSTTFGEDHIIIGSDYGHNDPSKEPEFVKNIRAREDVSPAVVEKILCHNARELYGLS